MITWILPTDLISTSAAIMRPNGRMGCEGLALWLGNADGDRIEVSHVVALHGPGFQFAPLQLQLSYRALETLTDLADQVGAYLVGQIHSHPGRMLELSEADVTYGIRRQDYISLVCPHYAQKDTRDVHECGVHLFDHGSYRRMAPTEVAKRLSVNSGPIVRLDCEVVA